MVALSCTKLLWALVVRYPEQKDKMVQFDSAHLMAPCKQDAPEQPNTRKARAGEVTRRRTCESSHRYASFGHTAAAYALTHHAQEKHGLDHEEEFKSMIAFHCDAFWKCY